jgi:hypothetical protein
MLSELWAAEGSRSGVPSNQCKEQRRSRMKKLED